MKLPDLQYAALLDEIAFAIGSDIPVSEAMQRLGDRRLGRVGRVAKRIGDQLSRGVSLAEAVSVVPSPATGQVVSAIESAQQSGDSVLLTRIANQMRQRCEYLSRFRLAWFYPIVLLGLGYAGAVFAMGPLIRDNQGRDFQWPSWLVSLSDWLEVYAWLPLVVVVFVVIAIAIVYAKRRRLPKHARLNLFFHSLADQMESGVADEPAIKNAARIAGDPVLASIENPTLRSPAIAKWIAESNGLVGPFDSNQPQVAMIAQLRYLGAKHGELARRSALFWSILFPRVAMAGIGGGFVFFYAFFIIAPIYRQVAQW